MRGRFALVVLVLSALLGPAAFAQTTSNIVGRVTDEQGVPLPGAAVEATGPALQGNRTAVTDSQGRYRLSLVPPGTYVLTFTLQGFSRETQNGVAVGLGKDTSLNANLHISTKTEMTVTSEAAAMESS